MDSGKLMKKGIIHINHELDEVERAVLKLAEEMANTTQKVEYIALYHKATRELNYSKIEISNAINKLYRKKYIRVGSRLTRGRVLENPTRKKVYEYVEAHLGAHVRELLDELSVTPHILYWHLNMLENFEFMYHINFSKYVNYFPSAFDKSMVKPFLVLKNKNALRVFKRCLKIPFPDFKSLKNGLNLSPNVILYHLNNLIKFSVVVAYKINQTVVYGIKPEKVIPIKSYYNITDEQLQKIIEIQNQLVVKNVKKEAD